MRVIFAPASESDLGNIGAFIAKDSPRRAASFVEELQAACVSIGHLPFGAAVIPGYGKRGYRRKPYRGYLIIYRVQNDQVEIARVIQGSRDLDRVLGKTNP